MSEANKELVRRHFEEIFNRQNFAVCDEIVAEDYVEHAVAPFGQSAPGRVNGPQATRQTVEWLLAQFPDMRMTIEAMVSEGDTVAVRVLSEGTNLGPLNGVVPPTGRALHAPARATGTASPTANSPSTGPRARTCQPCCSSGLSNPRAGRRPEQEGGWHRGQFAGPPLRYATHDDRGIGHEPDADAEAAGLAGIISG